MPTRRRYGCNQRAQPLHARHPHTAVRGDIARPGNLVELALMPAREEMRRMCSTRRRARPAVCKW
jgi:hypothetical protein